MPAFQYAHRVTYAECTMGNHVYYARYLDILEAARGEFFRHLGTSFQAWQDQNVIFPVVECRIRYAAPARYDDVLAVEVRIDFAKGPRLNFGYRITNGAGKLILEAETAHVCTALDEKPRRIPDGLKRSLDADAAKERPGTCD